MGELRVAFSQSPRAAVTPMPEAGPTCDDCSLIAGIRRGDAAAATAFYQRYRGLVERTLVRILGFDSELADAVQDTFIRALGSTRLLRDPKALPSWIIRISVCTASDVIRRRKRGRLFHLFSETDDLPEPAVSACDSASDLESRRALRAAQAVLDGLPVKERIAFSLRRLDGMELRDVAHACNCSLATIKRRLARAEQRFLSRAEKQPELRSWLAENKGEGP
jgi:RNA polymerase sigma-70 factor, ECF subfamily